MGAGVERTHDDPLLAFDVRPVVEVAVIPGGEGQGREQKENKG